MRTRKDQPLPPGFVSSARTLRRLADSPELPNQVRSQVRALARYLETGDCILGLYAVGD